MFEDAAEHASESAWFWSSAWLAAFPSRGRRKDLRLSDHPDLDGPLFRPEALPRRYKPPPEISIDGKCFDCDRTKTTHPRYLI